MYSSGGKKFETQGPLVKELYTLVIDVRSSKVT